jgi:DNA-binding transcriptional ArsR family regulator
VKRVPIPPHPDILRRPRGPFGWLDAHLLHDRWLAQMQPDATAVLVLLALAADRHGASFYSRGRMAECLGIDIDRVDRALAKLEELGLVALRAWRPGLRDGVWQILPVAQSTAFKHRATVSIAEVLRSLGMGPGARA